MADVDGAAVWMTTEPQSMATKRRGSTATAAAADPPTADLIDLDDQEFDLPTVKKEPTLEEILNDDGPPLDCSALHYTDDERESISSQDSSLSERSAIQSGKRGHQVQHYAIVRHIIMKKISNQLSSAMDLLGAGVPTALAVSSQIAIGTSNGLVLVFGAGQALKWCLSSVAAGAKYGPVSALSLNVDCTRLLCAFSKGQITMWDLTNGKLLRSIDSAHMPDAGIVSVRFTDDRTVAVSSDTRGAVFEMKFRHLIGKRTCESQCLFSGVRGGICVVEPLRLQNLIPDFVDGSIQIVAMASQNKAVVVTVRPQFKIVCFQDLSGDSDSFPSLAWQGIPMTTGSSMAQPALAIAKDQTIKIVQVFCEDADDVKVSDLLEVQVSFELLSISWVYPNTMIALDIHEVAHVLDVHSGEELEFIDLTDIGFVYDVNIYVRPTESGSPEVTSTKRLCSQSFVTSDGQLFILGSKGIHVLTLRSWSDRLDLLVRHGCYDAALDLATSFYDGTAKAVLGLTGNKDKRRDTVTVQIIALLDSFVDLSMTRLSPSHGKVELLEAHYQKVVSVCVETCLHIGKLDFLFGRVYEKFAEDVIARDVFLECLEPYILKDELKHIAPVVMKDFLQHYESKGMLSAVDACIVHLDITNLDTKEIIDHCWEYRLYDALIYVYNRGLHDYVTPLGRLLSQLAQSLETESPLTKDNAQLGNKVLVYISCCLCGRSYPLDDLPSDLVIPVRDGVLECLAVDEVGEHGELGKNFPHLRTLVDFGAREFFNVLELAFDVDDLEMDKRQSIVDKILEMMVEDTKFTATQFGALFTFLARQMARHDRSISVDPILFDRVLESLCAAKENLRHEECQQALIELLDTDHLKNFERNRLLAHAESAHFFRVCEKLYTLNREFDMVLPCYWNDSARQGITFKYILESLSGTSLTDAERAKIRIKAIENFDRLVKINSRESAKLVLLGYVGDLRQVAKQLMKKEAELYSFLRNVYEFHSNNPETVDFVVKDLEGEPAVLEKYIEIMCRKSPEEIIGFLKSNEGYRLEETMDICQRYQVIDALVYLKEKAEDYEGAFDILLQKLQSGLDGMDRSGTMVAAAELANDVIVQFLQKNSFRINLSQRELFWFSNLKAIMTAQENLRLLLKTSREKLYAGCAVDEVKKEFPTSNGISRGLESNVRLTNGGTFLAYDEALQSLNKMMHRVIDAMMTYFPMQLILQRVLNNPAYISGTFGELKDLLLGVLDSSVYETTLINTCALLANKDIHDRLTSLVGTASRGVFPERGRCRLCSISTTTIHEKESVVCFQCSHSYHYACLSDASALAESPEGQRVWKCIQCDRRFRPGALRPRKMSDSVAMTSENSIERQTQASSFKAVRKSLKSPSKLQMLLELKENPAGGRPSRRIHCERFGLRVTAPPPP